MKYVRLFALAGALSAFASPSLAETIDASGVGRGKAMNEVTPVTDALIVIQTQSMYEGFDTKDPANPLASATGPCWGSMMMKAGAVSGEGLCRYTDGDGDVAVMKWMATGMSETGRTLGDWMVQGGTGKWASASGGGTFNAGTTDGVYTNEVSGEFVMK